MCVEKMDQVEVSKLEIKLIHTMRTVDRLARIVDDYDGPFSTCPSGALNVRDSDLMGTVGVNASLLVDRLCRLCRLIGKKRGHQEV